jgi:plastocyanin
MSIYRICLVGALALLGACATPPERAYSPPPMPAATTPEPVLSPVAIAPASDQSTPPVTVAAPVAEPSSMPAVKPAPSAPAVAPMPKAVPASKPETARKSAPTRSMSAKPVPAPKSVVKPTVKPMPPSAAEVGTMSAETVEKAAPSHVMLQGQVSLEGARGQAVAAGDLADTLVYYVPAAGGARVKPGHFTIYTHNRDFNPEAISVPQGSTVTFINLDDVRHNVFSVTPGSDFNLGYQGSGEKASHTFGHAGVVLVSCNVHRSMELDLLVVPTPYSAKVGADGNFTLQGLPAGSGKLYFWNPRSQLSSQAVTLPMSAAVKQKLVVSKPHMDTQLNTGNGT